MAETAKELQKRQEQEFRARVNDYLKTFTSPHGQQVLKDMRKAYCGSLWNKDPNVRDRNIAQHDVVKAIEALILAGKNPQQIEDLFRGPEDEGFEL